MGSGVSTESLREYLGKASVQKLSAACNALHVDTRTRLEAALLEASQVQGAELPGGSACAADVSNLTNAVTVQSVSGGTLAEIKPPLPSTLIELRNAIAAQSGIHASFIKVLQGGSLLVDDAELVDAYESQMMVAVIDQSAAFLWDTIKNPEAEQLVVEGGHVRCPNMRTDYINVVTQAPLPAGVHFVEFVMHHKGDEQWCGVVQDKALGWGKKVSGHSAEFQGCFYYCGRRSGRGLLAGDPSYSTSFVSVGSGDILGMAIDCDNRVAAFACNGKVQGAARLPEGPLYLLTHVDTTRDHVELRRKGIDEAPLKLMQVLSGEPCTKSPT
eukprot:TRINITY_DN21623_c0_g1_i1.p1 TRINITY_DN21623_c0_g1~~TRINITY_DN21623_c0_g1_i1.p1  ORF type:complete len:350 (-),score=52.26 TRINITY_DN21623_c0_g1_i1:156-1139(-)